MTMNDTDSVYPNDDLDDEIDTVNEDGEIEYNQGLPDPQFPDESIARQNFLLLKERSSEPEVEIPLRDYSQKNDYEEDADNPNLSLHCYRMSEAAKVSWSLWFDCLKPEEALQMLLSDEEYKEYLEYMKAVSEEDEDYSLEQENKAYRACSEVPGFTTTKVSDIEYDTYKIPFNEIRARIVLTDYQTNIWRKSYRADQDSDDFGFMDPKHDPDFLPPCSVSKNWLIKPASRPYNLSFSVEYEKDGKKFLNISKPKSAKDYTTVEDLKYVVAEKGYSLISIKDITPENEIKWEVDLRLSRRNGQADGKESLIPDPRDYQKIDCTSKLGRRLLRSLRENPYHEWQEVSWTHQDQNVTALVRTAKDYLVWVYVDQSALVSKRSRFQRVIFPQLLPIEEKHVSGKKVIIGYSIRYSDPNELKNALSYRVNASLKAIITKLERANFVPHSRSTHDSFGCLVLTYVNASLKTPKQRFLARIKEEGTI